MHDHGFAEHIVVSIGRDAGESGQLRMHEFEIRIAPARFRQQAIRRVEAGGRKAACIEPRHLAAAAAADIGCGSGREVAWLNASGFPASGFDASDGLLAEARRRYPDFKFVHAELPALAGVAANAYDNVLCETVIMHLDRTLIAPSVRRMFEIVKPGGVFYLSWRVTDDADLHDGHGRLYAAFDSALVRDELKK